MKKEVIIAIVVGFILGLIITFGIYTANQALKKTTPQKNLPSAENPPPAASPSLAKLQINQPENNLVVKEKEITVSGQTEPKTAVAIMAEEYNDIFLTDEEGIFSTKVPLLKGTNQIKVVSINKNGKKQKQILNVVYSTAKIE